MEILNYLFPDSAQFELNQWSVEEGQKEIKIKLSSKQDLINCPRCYHPTHQTHSYYERTISDLPWADYSIKLKLRVRKFFCRNQECLRRIFTEQLPTLVLPWARRTKRLTHQLTAIGLELGGSAGVRLANYLNHQISRNTVLELIRRIPLPPIETPLILGVDDFAFRKRKTYGTVLIDLDKGRPIALLKDREASTLSQWLNSHPGVQIVSREPFGRLRPRSLAYAKAISEGAPFAIQVADRFHLLQNLAETLDQIFCTHAKVLKEVEIGQSKSTELQKSSEAIPVVLISPPAKEKKEKSKATARRNKRLAIYEQILRVNFPLIREKNIVQSKCTQTLKTISL